MANKKVVIFGEASESEGEDGESQPDPSESRNVIDLNEEESSEKYRKPSLFSFGPSNVISKLLNYSLQNPSLNPNNVVTREKKDPIHLSLLHRTLYNKNQQLYYCLSHLYRHHYEKASKDLHTISQRLVDAQKTIQNVDNVILRLKKDLRNSRVEILTLT